jgi:hypothetical protein
MNIDLVTTAEQSSHILRPTHIYNRSQYQQTCVRVVSLEDGQVMPKTSRDFKP